MSATRMPGLLWVRWAVSAGTVDQSKEVGSLQGALVSANKDLYWQKQPDRLNHQSC
jgi:hypothetical protein